MHHNVLGSCSLNCQTAFFGVGGRGVEVDGGGLGAINIADSLSKLGQHPENLFRMMI